jgi:peptidoglycan hydrolase CwlO-like protein
MSLGDAVILMMFSLFAASAFIYLAIENHGIRVKIDSMQAQVDSMIETVDETNTAVGEVNTALEELQKEVRD